MHLFTRTMVAALATAALVLAGCSDDNGSTSSGGKDAGPTDGSSVDGGADTSGTPGDGGGSDGSVTPSTCTDTPKATKDPGAAVCVVEKTGKEGLLVVADVLLPGKVVEGGAVLIDGDGKIACSGCGCADKAADATWVICKDAVVSPGLIDAHNHVGWLNGKPWVATENQVDPALRWEHRHDWRKGKRGHPFVNVSGGGASTDQKAFGELRYILTGGTAIFGSGDLSGLMRDLDSTGKGDNGLGQPGAKYDTFPLGDSSGTQLSSGCKYGNIHNPPGSSTDAYGPHVAEGIDAEARNEFLCLTKQGSDSKDVLDNRAALIHAVGLRAADYGLMGAKGMKMIWSPRSNVSLYGATADVTLAHKMGVTIGLGVDWLPSGSVNMVRELNCAAYLNDNHYGGYFSDEQLWRMATIGAAKALAMDDAFGSLNVGLAGDLAVFAKAGNKGHSAVVNGKTRDVALVVRGGEVLAGNQSIISALEPTCESVGDVCGVEKGVCVENTIGKSYADLMKKIGTPNYPLFFCGVPKNEPSCVPARTLKDDVVNGSSVYAGKSDPADKDGDGIANDADNCPGIFNPIRPLDNGKQPDTDGDGKGDVCDPCPLTPDSETCKPFNPADTDGDGIDAKDDNCPQVGNKDQADKDKDGKGDVCDECPDYKNEGDDGCPYDVTKLKTDKSLMGKRVAVKGLVVTAAAQGGFFAQKDGIPSVDHGGIYVYAGPSELPQVGDLIDVSGGTLTTFFSQKQLSFAKWKVVGKGKFEPRKIDKAAAEKIAKTDKFDSPHDGLLLQLVDAEVSDPKPAPGGGDKEGKNEFELASGLRVDDGMWPEGTPYITMPNKGQIITSIVGPISFRNNYMKVLPRGPKDFNLGPPEVLEVTPGKVFQFVGKSGPTVPEATVIKFTHVDDKDHEVLVNIADSTIAKAVGPFTLKAGESTLTVGVEGLKAGETTLTAKLKDGKKERKIDVVIVDPNADPAVASITPADVKLDLSSEAKFVVTLSNPATATGLDVALKVEPDGVGIAPKMVHVDGGKMSAAFTFKTGIKEGKVTITASTSSGSAKATVEVVDFAKLSLDLSGWTLIQTGSNKTWKIPDGTKVMVGGYVVIGRKADQAAFEKTWGVTFDKSVVYLNSKDKGMTINGDETFTLKDKDGKVVDGPTIKLAKDGNLQRKVPVGDAGSDKSWKAGAGTAGKDPTPGSGQGKVSPSPGIYISEFSDSTGSGKYVYEFVELHYPGPK